MLAGWEIEQQVISRHVAGTLRCSTSRTKMQNKTVARKSHKELEREDTLLALRTALKLGTTVYTILRHVSASGMCRWLDLYTIDANRPFRLTWSTAIALEWTYDRRREALKVTGAGMDMGFHAVYSLSAVLFKDGNALNHEWM